MVFRTSQRRSSRDVWSRGMWLSHLSGLAVQGSAHWAARPVDGFLRSSWGFNHEKYGDIDMNGYDIV